MTPPVRAYHLRLSFLTGLLVTTMLLLPLALGAVLAGWEWSAVFILLTSAMGLFRTHRSPDLPGTVALLPWQAPGLFTLIESLSERAGLRQVPEVRWVPGGQVNAAALLRGSTPVLVLTENLLAALDVRKLGAVLAHEASHLAHRDLLMFRVAITWQAATLVLSGLTILLSPLAVRYDTPGTIAAVLLAVIEPLLARWLFAVLSRTREFAADLGSVRLTGDPVSLADALEAIEYRPRTWWERIIGQRVRSQASTSEKFFRTHPPTTERIRRLNWISKRWSSVT